MCISSIKVTLVDQEAFGICEVTCNFYLRLMELQRFPVARSYTNHA
jgi:hypothetical protein